VIIRVCVGCLCAAGKCVQSARVHEVKQGGGWQWTMQGRGWMDNDKRESVDPALRSSSARAQRWQSCKALVRMDEI
jgi:hypothetical protein